MAEQQNELARRGLEKFKDAGTFAHELCLAVYIPSQSENMTEEWHMVATQGSAQYYQLRIVHKYIPLSQQEIELPKLEQQYGFVDVVGLTYDTAPYYLGPKYIIESDSEEIIAALNEVIASKDDNVHVYVGPDVDPEVLENLQQAAKELYEMIAKPKFTKDNMPECFDVLTRKQAIEAAKDFYLSNPADDIRIFQDQVKRIKDSDTHFANAFKKYGLA